MTTNVYIDGLNLYYGCLKGTPHRWLDLEALVRRLLPNDDVAQVRYFTARVSARSNDDRGPVSQSTYLRALGTLPKVSVHFGHFLTNTVSMPLATPPEHGPRTAVVIKTEEKGSDVNLAAFVLLDSFKGSCDTVVIVSNDSDLKEPVRMLRYDLGVTVGVINPHPARKRSRALSADAHFFKQLRPSLLRDCHLPNPMSDAQGTFYKPPHW